MTQEGATVSSSIVNTLNTIIGSGVLVLPYAFRTDSIILGTVILIIAGLANAFGMILQGASSKFLPNRSATFFSVCRITYPKLSVLFDFAIFLQCFGVGISYIVLTGDLLPLVFSFDGWSKHSMKLFYVLLSTLLVVPLCFMRRLDSLRYTSIIALTAIAYICLLIYGNFIYAYATDFAYIPADKIGEISLWRPQGVKPVFKTLAIVVLAYTCPNQFSIISELKNPTLNRISKIVYISMSITAFIFFTVAFTGYLTFGNTVNGNIILMYNDNIYSQLGRSLLVLMVLLSYPLMFHPARISFNNIFHSIQTDWLNKTPDAANESSPLILSDAPVDVDPVDIASGVVQTDEVPLPDSRFYFFTVLLLLCSYFSALALNSFELILSLVGSTGGVLISFVLPGFYGYKLLATDDEFLISKLYSYSPTEVNNPIFKNKVLKNCSLFLVIWGLFVMCICLYSSIFE